MAYFILMAKSHPRWMCVLTDSSPPPSPALQPRDFDRRWWEHRFSWSAGKGPDAGGILAVRDHPPSSLAPSPPFLVHNPPPIFPPALILRISHISNILSEYLIQPPPPRLPPVILPRLEFAPTSSSLSNPTSRAPPPQPPSFPYQTRGCPRHQRPDGRLVRQSPTWDPRRCLHLPPTPPHAGKNSLRYHQYVPFCAISAVNLFLFLFVCLKTKLNVWTHNATLNSFKRMHWSRHSSKVEPRSSLPILTVAVSRQQPAASGRQ